MNQNTSSEQQQAEARGAVRGMASQQRDDLGWKGLAWAKATFGADAGNPRSRATRFLEEALELAQACGVSRARAERLVERAYRPVPPWPALRVTSTVRELGQAAFTLAVLGESLGLVPSTLADEEFERVQALDPEVLRKSYREKIARGEAGHEPQQQDTARPPAPQPRPLVSFDPRRPFTTRDGKRAYVRPAGANWNVLYEGSDGNIRSNSYHVDSQGCFSTGKEDPLDLVNTDVSAPLPEVNSALAFDANKPFRTESGQSVAVSPDGLGGFAVQYRQPLASSWVVDKQGNPTHWPRSWAVCEAIRNIEAPRNPGSDHPQPTSPLPPRPLSAPPAQLVTRWANIYRAPMPDAEQRTVPRQPLAFTVGDLFSTCHEAELAAAGDLVARVRVEFREGDGL